MIISIHQPDYIPYIGYFYKIAKSDIFMFLDDVQFSNDNMHDWNRIKTPQGECRLKIPVEYNFGDNINQVRARDELKWREKHLRTMEMNYARAKYFSDIYPALKEIIMGNYSNLAELNISVNKFICKEFGFNTKFVLSSEIKVNTAKEERVIDTCLALEATTYLSGNGARAYQKEEHFNTHGIELKYTDYKPFKYTQLWKEFITNLSIIDYVFNHGFNWETIDMYMSQKIKGVD